MLAGGHRCHGHGRVRDERWAGEGHGGHLPACPRQRWSAHAAAGASDLPGGTLDLRLRKARGHDNG